MASEGEVMALFDKANPVPSLDLLDPIEPRDIGSLRDRSERSSEMTEIEVGQANSQVQRRWRVPVLVAVLAVIVATAMIIVQQNRVTEPVESTPTEAEAIAIAYLNAMANNNVEALHSLVSPSSDVDWGDQSAVQAWREAAGIVNTRQGCTQQEADPSGTVVECPWTYDSKLHRALGLEPSSMLQVFVIRDGRIQDEYETNVDDPDAARVWNEFRRWVATNHGADVATMYDEENGGAHMDSVSIALWEEYTDEFVAERGG